MSGDASVNGSLNGGGLNGGTVEGTKTLNIGTSTEAYTGASTFKVADFDRINVGKDSSAVVESISSSAAISTITKASEGSLIVNGSMGDFKGTLNVNEGTMNANIGLGASSVNIASGANLGVRINGENMLSNTSLVLANSGTISFTANTALESGTVLLIISRPTLP